MAYLLETNVVSELRRRRLAEAVLRWFDQVSARELHRSVRTISELHRGIENGRRRDAPTTEALDQ